MKCEYCSTENENGVKRCKSCGAEIKPAEAKEQFYKSDPFFYNGYICYCLRNGMIRQDCEVQFWLGMTLVERIVVDEEVLKYNCKDELDYMPFFWNLFLVAHGEKEVLEFKEKNDKYPATFKITRVENPEKERLRSLSMYDLAMESRR